MEFSKPNFFYRFLHRIYRFGPISWLLSVFMPPIDRFVFKISRRKLSMAQLLSGLPVILLTCKGAKSGKDRNVPLISIPVGDKRTEIVLIASNWGKPKNPAWYYNLKANPDVVVAYKGEEGEYLADEVKDENQYQDYWNTAVGYYSGYNNYKKKTSRNKIPIIKLTPKNNDR